MSLFHAAAGAERLDVAGLAGSGPGHAAAPVCRAGAVSRSRRVEMARW